MNLSGGCLCGAVRYEFEGEPRMAFLCHCRDCQRSGGSLVHLGVMVPEAKLKLHGALTSYHSKGDAGRGITREFCPRCGSGIGNRLELSPGMFVLKGGTLDEPNAVAPQFELYARTKATCLRTPDGLPSFEAEVTRAPRTLGRAPE
jgi:hypothetical protein